MSEENVEVARKVLGEFNAFMRDELSSEAFAEAYDPQVEIHWHDRQTYPDTPQRLRGVQDLIAFTEEYRDGWADLTAEVLELTEAPDGRILVFVRSTARGRQSGVPIEVHFSRSTQSKMERCAGWSTSAIGPMPSKPPGCGSRQIAALEEKQ